MFELVVLTDYDDFKAVDHITDPKLVAEYQETRPMFVVAVKKAKARKAAAQKQEEQKETV